MWDKERIQRLLAENDKAVIRAISAIYALQTEQEKSSETTVAANGVGFNYTDARMGTYYAQYIAKTGRLTGRHLERARKMSLKYWRQLAEIANAKEGKGAVASASRNVMELTPDELEAEIARVESAEAMAGDWA